MVKTNVNILLTPFKQNRRSNSVVSETTNRIRNELIITLSFLQRLQFKFYKPIKQLYLGNDYLQYPKIISVFISILYVPIIRIYPV